MLVKYQQQDRPSKTSLTLEVDWKWTECGQYMNWMCRYSNDTLS